MALTGADGSEVFEMFRKTQMPPTLEMRRTPPSGILQTAEKEMIRKIFLLISCLVCAYVLSKPTPPEPHHDKVLHRAKRWEDLPNVTFTFDCDNRAVGFYADVEHHCQIFHMCDEDGRRIPYICANDTSFNQQYRVCDWAYNFDCSDSQNWYFLNELTYVTDPPKEKAPRG